MNEKTAARAAWVIIGLAVYGTMAIGRDTAKAGMFISRKIKEASAARKAKKAA